MTGARCTHNLTPGRKSLLVLVEVDVVESIPAWQEVVLAVHEEEGLALLLPPSDEPVLLRRMSMILDDDDDDRSFDNATNDR